MIFDPKSMTIREASSYLGIETNTVHVLIKQHRIRTRPREEWPNGKCTLVDRNDVMEYFLTRRKARQLEGADVMDIIAVPNARNRKPRVVTPIEPAIQALIDRDKETQGS